MSSQFSKKPDTKDQLKKAIESNPCGICRAYGIPTCKGHGKAAGGGQEPSDAATGESPTYTSMPTPLEIQLTQSNSWRRPDESELTFTCENRYAFFTPYLHLDKCRIVFHGLDRLISTKQTLLDDFFQEIIDEFNAFKEELAKRGVSVEQMSIRHDGNKLTLSIPNPHYYQAFIQRLIDKNMLPMQAEKLSENKHALSNAEHNQHDTSPNPFSINGPRPTSD